ncbi:MAG: hypothetical protein IPO27_04340 [Bacteroidetes bacterium]|nr:hypothetical protein [Bacteroidota bacterium]
MNKASYCLAIAIAGAVAISSCGTNNTAETYSTANVAAVDTTPVDEKASYEFSYTIANIPPPLMVLDEYAKANIPADGSLINSTDNIDNYKTAGSQALNFGIFGVDLGYLVVNGRNTDALKYFNTTRTLAQNLGLGATFDQFAESFQRNAENRDSIMRITDMAYAATDKYLRSNERLATASQILVGSWIEGQHITLNSLKNQERTAAIESLYQRVWEQRLHLENIVKTTSEFSSDKDLAGLNKELAELLELYKKPADAKSITKEMLTEMAAKVSSIRNSITK